MFMLVSKYINVVVIYIFIMNMLYIGSCRYMYGYKWDYFPARLHSTTEILYFLDNINNIETIINDNPP
jgi:hypothetical protein